MNRPRVIVIETPRDMSGLDKAGEYGDLRYLHTPEEPRPPMFAVLEYSTSVLEKLNDLEYDPLQDFIVMSGPSVTNYIGLAAIVAHCKTIRVLLWNANTRSYIERMIGESPSEPAN